MHSWPIVITGGLALVAGCAGDDAADFSVRALDAPVGAGSGEAYLAARTDGTPILSWLEPAAEGSALRYAVLSGGAWSAAHEVTGGEDLFVNWADFPSVTPITDDVWVAHWLRLKPESFGAYDIATAISGDSGATWSAPTQLNLDDTESEHGFVKAFPWGSDIGIVWLDGRELAEWSFDNPEALLGTSLRYVRMGYSGAVEERGIIDELVCDCCKTDVAITRNGPIVIYRDRTEDEIRDVVVRRHDSGSWLEPRDLGAEHWLIEGCPVNGPAIASRDDEVAAAWFTAAGGRGRVRFARSTDGGSSFLDPVDLDSDDPFGQVDLVLRKDGTAVVSWWRDNEADGISLVARTVSPSGDLGALHTITQSDVAQPVDVPQMIAVGEDLLLFAWTTLEGEGSVRTALVAGIR